VYGDKIIDVENAVVLFCRSKSILSDKPAFIHSMDVNLTPSKAFVLAEPLDIEASYRYQKNLFGFDEYQVECLISTKRFWSTLFYDLHFSGAFQDFK